MKKLALALTLILCVMLAALVACTGDPSDTADTDAPAETWLCACGQDNGGKFCSECGTQCEGTAKFCSVCGNKF